MAGKVVDVTLRLIDKISSPLNKVGKGLANSSRQWQRAGRQIERAGKQISNVGAGMTKTVTAPIAGAGAACVKLASDFEAGMSKVQSISGATGNELDALSKKAQEMGAKTKFSATEASEAYSYMAMAGWKAEDMLDGIEGVMYLAGATGEDLASTSDIVTDGLTAFGMTAADTERFVNVLASTSSSANTNVAMMGETFKYVAPVAGSLGYNVEDVSTAIGLMANSGIKASSAGTSLRSWMSRMASPTKEVQNAMTALGLSLTDSEGNMKDFKTMMSDTKTAFAGLDEAQKAQYASALAGKSGMSGLLAIVNSSDKDFNSLSESIYNSSGACKDMYDVANDNLQGQLTILKSTTESLAISFGERLTPYVKSAVEWIQGLAEKFNGLSDRQKDVIVKVALVAASIGPALLIFGKLTSTVGRTIATFGRIGKAFKTFGSISAMITSPVGIVIAVLAAVALAAIWVVKHWDSIKATAQDVFGDKLSQAGKYISSFLAIAGPILTKVGEIASMVFNTVIGGAIGAAMGFFNSLIDSISSVIGGIMTVLNGLIDFVTGVFTGNWSQAWEGVKNIFGGAFQALSGLVKTPMNAVIGLINGAVSGINNLGLTIPKWVPGLGGKTFSIDIPTIPALAVGTENWQGGLAQISERGGEIFDLPRGTRVYPHDKSVQQAYTDGQRSGGNITVSIPKLADQIIVREDSDIDRIATALAEKLEKVSQNLGGGELGYIY